MTVFKGDPLGWALTPSHLGTPIKVRGLVGTEKKLALSEEEELIWS